MDDGLTIIGFLGA